MVKLKTVCTLCTLYAIVLMLPLFAWSADKQPVRVFDNPPKEPIVVKPDIPKEYEGLIKIFNEYWEARKKGDFEKAYSFEASDFRKSTGLDAYKGKFGKDVQLVNVRALGVKKTSEKEVMVTGITILKVLSGASIIDTAKPLNDKWIQEGETWKHVRQ
jgi:hypothetical protein